MIQLILTIFQKLKWHEIEIRHVSYKLGSVLNYEISMGKQLFGKIDLILICLGKNKTAFSVKFVLKCLDATEDYDHGVIIINESVANYVCIVAAELASHFTLYIYIYVWNKRRKVCDP